MQILAILVVIMIILTVLAIVLASIRHRLREAKNYERGLKMSSLLIHLPPPSEDIDVGGRDKREVTEETIAPAQTLYNILASTSKKASFKNNIYGQRHIGLEMIAHGGSINYYVVAPTTLIGVIEQAITSAYPSSRVEQVEDPNFFSAEGKSAGVVGGEFSLINKYAYPIATYQETKKDVMQSMLNSFINLNKNEGVGIQLLIRPADKAWAKSALTVASKKKKGDKERKGWKKMGYISEWGTNFFKALSKPPEWSGAKSEDKPKEISGSDQALIESIENKTRYPGFETLIRVVASTTSNARSQAIVNNLVATFSLFNSEGRNGLKYSPAKDTEKFITAFIFKFFPQEKVADILNAVELATIFHLPDQRNTPTSQVKRQDTKQVDGPAFVPEDGFLLGYNVYRGIKKPIKITEKDRDRHMYIVGQTGTGKSKMLQGLIIQDMLDGNGLCYIDPHGQDLTEVMGLVPKERIDDVIYFCPSDIQRPIGLNILEYDKTHPEQRFFMIQECIAILYQLYDPNRQGMMGARFETMFRNAALTVMADPAGGTFIDIPKLFVDQAYLNKKLEYVTDDGLKEYWLKEVPDGRRSSDFGEVIGWFSSKFGAIRSDETMRNIIGQINSGINIRDAMDSKKIVFINLSKGLTGELNTKLLGLIFVAKFAAAALSRADQNEIDRVPFTLYIDEFQNFITETIATILSEARKYKLRLVMANQYIGQLTDEIRDAVLGNVGSLIALRSSTNDADILAKYFQPTFDIEDFTRLPNQNAVAKVLMNGVPTQPFSMTTVPFSWQSNVKLFEALRRLSGAKYGVPKNQIDAEISERLKIITPVGGGAQPQNQIPEKPKSFLEEWAAKNQSPSNPTPQNLTPPPQI